MSFLAPKSRRRAKTVASIVLHSKSHASGKGKKKEGRETDTKKQKTKASIGFEKLEGGDSFVSLRMLNWPQRFYKPTDRNGNITACDEARKVGNRPSRTPVGPDAPGAVRKQGHGMHDCTTTATRLVDTCGMEMTRLFLVVRVDTVPKLACWRPRQGLLWFRKKLIHHLSVCAGFGLYHTHARGKHSSSPTHRFVIIPSWVASPCVETSGWAKQQVMRVAAVDSPRGIRRAQAAHPLVTPLYIPRGMVRVVSCSRLYKFWHSDFYS